MSEFAGDKTVSLYIKDPVSDNDVGIDFYSKENGSNTPVLSVITEPASFHTAPTDSTPFVHPGALFKQSDLDRMKYMVAAGIDPWLTSFNELAANSKASYNYSVQGDSSWTIVTRGGTHGPQFESDVTAAYLNSLMWAITGDTRYADKAVEIFNTWSNLTEVTGGGTEALNAGLYAWKLVEAAEIIKSTYTGWAAADLQKFKDMLVYPGYSQTGFRPPLRLTMVHSIGGSIMEIRADTGIRISSLSEPCSLWACSWITASCMTGRFDTSRVCLTDRMIFLMHQDRRTR